MERLKSILCNIQINVISSAKTSAVFTSYGRTSVFISRHVNTIFSLSNNYRSHYSLYIKIFVILGTKCRKFFQHPTHKSWNINIVIRTITYKGKIYVEGVICNIERSVYYFSCGRRFWWMLDGLLTGLR